MNRKEDSHVRGYLELSSLMINRRETSPLKIAILGTRGIPARYGGFETLADELSRRLVQRGHQVTVYCRRPFTRADDTFDARIRRVILPTVSNKYLDTLVHTSLAVLQVIFTDSKVLLICNVANSPWAWIPRLVGKPTVLNVDGLDRKRRKWNIIGRSFLHFCEALSTFTPSRIVTDAKTVQKYYRDRYGVESEMIAYGADFHPSGNHFSHLGLTPKHYILYVARLEPENNPELVINAYRSVDTDWPLVIVGGNPYKPAYVEQLKSLADRRVIFTGPVYSQNYWSLQENAGIFVFAGEIGGIHPALVEAMAAGNAILYLDTASNRETVLGCGAPFDQDENNLTTKLQTLIGSPDHLQSLRFEAQEAAKANYSWDAVVDKYEALFASMLGAR